MKRVIITLKNGRKALLTAKQLQYALNNKNIKNKIRCYQYVA